MSTRNKWGAYGSGAILLLLALTAFAGNGTTQDITINNYYTLPDGTSPGAAGITSITNVDIGVSQTDLNEATA